MILGGYVLERIAYLVYDAQLYVRLGEYAQDGIGKALEVVRTGYQYVLEPTVVQVGKDL